MAGRGQDVAERWDLPQLGAPLDEVHEDVHDDVLSPQLAHDSPGQATRARSQFEAGADDVLLGDQAAVDARRAVAAALAPIVATGRGVAARVRQALGTLRRLAGGAVLDSAGPE